MIELLIYCSNCYNDPMHSTSRTSTLYPPGSGQTVTEGKSASFCGTMVLKKYVGCCRKKLRHL